MLSLNTITILASFSSIVTAYSSQLAFDYDVGIENRALDEIHQAALSEGGNVTVWHGGDEKNQQDGLKRAFEKRLLGMTLNITVDLSNHHDKDKGAFLAYNPLGFDQLYDDFKDTDGIYNSMFIFAWSIGWNTQFLNYTDAPKEYTDFLKPEFKDKIVLTYPNDDDAVLYQFDLILKQYGLSWFKSLFTQNPRWARGTATPTTIAAASGTTTYLTFSASIGPGPCGSSMNGTYPIKGRSTTWPQTGAILKDSPHPETTKLLHSFMLTEYAESGAGRSTRKDLPPPVGYPNIMDFESTDSTKFSQLMRDRAAVERLRFFFESRVGSAQGLSPLVDDL